MRRASPPSDYDRRWTSNGRAPHRETLCPAVIRRWMTTSHWRALPSWYSAANNRHQQITETLSNYWFQRIIDWMTDCTVQFSYIHYRYSPSLVSYDRRVPVFSPSYAIIHCSSVQFTDVDSRAQTCTNPVHTVASSCHRHPEKMVLLPKGIFPTQLHIRQLFKSNQLGL